MKVRDLQHAVLPQATAEEQSRQGAVVGLRRFLNRRVRPRNVEVYPVEAATAFFGLHGREAQSPEEVQQAFLMSPTYRMWSAVNRAAQEMIWVSVGEPIYRDLDRMTQAAQALISSGAKRGSLTLDDAYVPSPEVADIDIHLQPGGYAMDRGETDIVAGALYECGGNVFSFGQGIGRGDSKAAVVIRLLNEQFGSFRPRRILDIGCSAGAASAAWAAHFPDAEVHAVDIGAAMLRYAHARAESLGVAVHFHQMDASAMGFEDNSFDLVVSHNLMHEIGAEKRRAMMREAHRVVRQNGIVIHQDVAIRNLPTIVHQVERDWDTHFNDEVHWSTYQTSNLVSDLREAGFSAEAISEHDLPAIHGSNRWYAISARKTS